MDEYQDRFPADLPGVPLHRDKYDIKIEIESNAKPHFRGMGRYSPAELKEMKDQVDWLLERGMIESSQSPWGAAVLFIPKKDKLMRMCVDYRMLNKFTLKTKYPLPLLDKSLAILGEAKVFSKIDFKSGYWQLRIAKESQYLTGLRTRYGQFE